MEVRFTSDCRFHKDYCYIFDSENILFSYLKTCNSILLNSWILFSIWHWQV